jgi:hypothetical protein
MSAAVRFFFASTLIFSLLWLGVISKVFFSSLDEVTSANELRQHDIQQVEVHFASPLQLCNAACL